MENPYSSYEQHFDAQYRPKLIQDTLGRSVQFTYGQDDGPQKITTSAGLEVEYEYDSAGRLIDIYDLFQGKRHYSYNSQNQITYEMNGEGTEFIYQYDSLNRLAEVYCPFIITSLKVIDGQTVIKGDPRYLTSFEYDERSGLLKCITFPDGQKQTYTYNHQDLPIQLELPNGITISREYDQKHRLKKVKSQGNEIYYDHDNRDRITRITSQKEITRFSYDAFGNLISHIDPSHRETQYAYDSFEKLIQTIDPLHHVSTYEYGPSGLNKMVLPNGSTREIFYDEYSRPVAIR